MPFRRPRNDELVLVHDPGIGLLSPYAMEKLESIARRYGAWSPSRLRAYTHRFPEWEKNAPGGDGMNDIPDEDLLEAVGRLGQAAALQDEVRQQQAVQALFAGLGQ